jgi:hypothetical protein
VPLEFSPLEIPYGQLDTHTDPTAMEPGTLTTAQNVSSDVDGRYSKRFGYETIEKPTPGTSDANRLARRNNQFLMFAGGLQYKKIQPTDGWSDGFLTPFARPSQQSIAMEQSRNYIRSGRATVSGVSMHAWIDTSTGNVEVRLFSEADESVINSYSDSSADYEIVQVLAVGTQLCVFYSSSAGQLIKYRTADPTTNTFGTLTTLFSTTDVFAGTVPYPFAPFDVVAVSSTDVCVAWADDTPNIRVIRRNVVAHTNTWAALTLAAEEPDGGLGVGTSSSTVGAVVWSSATIGAVRIRGFNPTTGAAIFAVATVETTSLATGTNVNCGVCAGTNAPNLFVTWDRRETGGVKGSTRHMFVTSGGAIGTVTSTPNVFLHSKPWLFGSLNYVVVLANFNTQETYFTVAMSPSFTNGAAPFAMHAYRTAYPDLLSYSCLSNIDEVSTGIYKFSAPIAYKFLSNSTFNAAVSSFGLDFTDEKRFMWAELGGTTMFTGGHTFRYDGTSTLENNFLLYPEILAATPGAVGGSGMNNGTYSYLVVFEASDANGNVDRSTTSLPKSATTTAGAGLGKVTLEIHNLPVTWHTPSNQRIIASIFRTEAGGETYYFITSQTVDTTQTVFAYVDQANDSTIISRRIIYTQGGVLDREPAPPCDQLITHNNRIWGFTEKTVFYSGDYVPGESPWFSTIQQFRIEAGGNITAIASLDERLIIFKRDRIFRVSGRGGNAQGTGSDLTPPEVITSDCGCIDMRSLVVIPQGIMFQSDKGLYMLSRGDELTFIGMPVSAYLDTYPVVRSAVMMPKTREVRFQVSDGAGEGMVLVYNYRDNRWTTHTNYDYDGLTDRQDSVVVDGSYYTVDADANISKETDGEFTDPDNSYIVSELETGWIKPAGKQGLVRCQRMTFLNEFMDDHVLEIEIDKNYVDTAVQSSQFTSAEIESFPQEQVSIHVQDQQGEAWRIRMTDATSAGVTTREGFRAKGVTLLVGVKRGTVEKIMQAGAKG